MGEDAVEINNKLLEVIRPFVAKLCSMGMLQNRDYRTVWYKTLVALFFFCWPLPVIFVLFYFS